MLCCCGCWLSAAAAALAAVVSWCCAVVLWCCAAGLVLWLWLRLLWLAVGDWLRFGCLSPALAGVEWSVSGSAPVGGWWFGVPVPAPVVQARRYAVQLSLF